MKERFARLSKEFRATLSLMGDLVILNLLFLLCCLPVVTIGAAGSACYAGLFRIVRKKETGLPIRAFLKDFAAAFKQSTVVWLLMLFCFAILAGDAWFAVVYSEPDNKFFLIFAIVVATALLFAAIWFFPLVARFQNKLGAQIKNAFLLAFAQFPRTLLALLIWVLVIGIPVVLFDVFTYFGWLRLACGISLPAYWTAKLFRKQLKLTPSVDDEDAPYEPNYNSAE